MRRNFVVECENISPKCVFQEQAKKGNVELISAVQSDGFSSVNVIRGDESGVAKLCDDVGALGISCCVEEFTPDNFDCVLVESVNATLRLVGTVFHRDFDRCLYALPAKKLEGAMLSKIVNDSRDIAFFGIVSGFQILQVSGAMDFYGAIPIEQSDVVLQWFGFEISPKAGALKSDLINVLRRSVASGENGDIRWIWESYGQSYRSLPLALDDRMCELREYVGSKKANRSVEDDRTIEDIARGLRRRLEEYGQSGVRRSTAIQRDLAVFDHLSDRDLAALAKRDLNGFGDLGRMLVELREKWKNSRGSGLRNAERVVNTPKKLKERLVRLIDFLGEGES